MGKAKELIVLMEKTEIVTLLSITDSKFVFSLPNKDTKEIKKEQVLDTLKRIKFRNLDNPKNSKPEQVLDQVIKDSLNQVDLSVDSSYLKEF